MKYLYVFLISLILLSACDRKADKTEFLNSALQYNDSIYNFIKMSEMTDRRVEHWQLKLKFLRNKIKSRYSPISDYPESKIIYDKLLAYLDHYIRPDSSTYNHERVLYYNDNCRGEIYKLVMAEFNKLSKE